MIFEWKSDFQTHQWYPTVRQAVQTYSVLKSLDLDSSDLNDSPLLVLAILKPHFLKPMVLKTSLSKKRPAYTDVQICPNQVSSNDLGYKSGLDSLLKTWFRHICQRVFFHPVGEDEPIVIKDGCPDGSPGSDVTLSSQLSPISTRCECRTSISSLTRFDIGLMLATEFDDDSRVSPTLLSSTSIN